MIIIGIDYSMSSPGLVKVELNESLDIIRADYQGFSSVAKTAKLDDNIIHFKKDHFNNNFDRFTTLTNFCSEFIESWGVPDYVAMEDYAMGSHSGMNFTIGEATILTKLAVYNTGCKFRLYSPTLIKKYATGKGNAKKEDMQKAYSILGESYLDLDKLPINKNPREDIVDAYWIMKLLQCELKLRYGIIELKSLNLKQIEVFNAVSKSNKDNLLVRDFIYKNLDNID